ncbi:MAG: hypothetical protein KatS3mg031_1450 [Chitinophagales bacterium]|nr:MAG: hypothetical protein KatS3mg031_1450 [Chitinophagales bacterium]
MVRNRLAFSGLLVAGILSLSAHPAGNDDLIHNPDVSGFHFKLAGILNTGNEAMPLVGQLSKDGLKLYFTSQNYKGEKQLFVMKRLKPGDAFQNPERVNVPFPDNAYDMIMPSVSADESMMVFVSSADGTQKGNDIYMAFLQKQDPANTSLVRTLDEINTSGISDSYPWLSGDGLRIYFTKQQGSNIDFYFASRSSIHEPFGQAKKMELTLPKAHNNMSCILSADELEIFALSGDKIYYATRENLFSPFSTPVVLAQSAHEGFITGITMTPDKSELFVFNSIGFRNTQILHFINTEAGKGERTKVTAATR